MSTVTLFIIFKMSNTGFNLPVIDISCIGLDKEDPLDYSSKDVTSTAKQLCDAFKNVGFVYIKNHGITDELVCILKAYSTSLHRISSGGGVLFCKMWPFCKLTLHLNLH